MLLYCGAYTDLRPLMRFSHSHKEFIYVDGLPSSNYFPCTLEKLRDTMIEELKRERAYQSHEMKDDHFVLRTVGEQTLYYFHDTLDKDMFKKNGPLLELLPRVTALYMCGFTPNVTENLPSIKTLIYTDGCSPYREESTLAFDWKSLEKIEIPEYQTDKQGWTTGYYIDYCTECDSPVCIYESFYGATV